MGEYTTEYTTESTTVFMEPVLEYTMLTQPTSMELESMVPTHTHKTPISNTNNVETVFVKCLIFRHKRTLASKNISQLRKIPKKSIFFFQNFFFQSLWVI